MSTTLLPQKYRPASRADKDLPPEWLVAFIKNWVDGHGSATPDVWSTDMKDAYTLFYKRQHNHKGKKPRQLPSKKDVDYTSGYIITDKDTTLPDGWLDDFMYYRYLDLHGYSRVVPMKKWKSIMCKGMCKYTCYKNFKNNQEYRTRTDNNLKEALNGNLQPIIDQRIGEDEMRQMQKRKREEDPEKLAAFKAKDNERNKKNNQKKRDEAKAAGYCPPTKEIFDAYMLEALLTDHDDELAFRHRYKWIELSRKNGVVAQTCDKIPYPPGWTEERQQAYQRWRNRNNILTGVTKDHKLTFTYAWEVLTRSSKLRGVPITLSKLDVARLAKSPCHYCGKEPIKKLSGIDRVDPDLFYSPENVVPACTQCNFSKHAMSKEDFIAKCTHIAKCSLGLPHAVDTSLFVAAQSNNQLYNVRRRGTTNGKRITLTDNEIMDLLQGDCVYCGLPNANGIDRIVNEIYYVHGNVQSCCKTCNLLKYVYSHESFVKMCCSVMCKHSQ